MRTILWDLLDKQPGMEVLAVADCGHSAVALSWQLKPDVVVMDINMPDLRSASAFSRILYAAPTAKLLALSFYPNRQYVEIMLKAGASGYLLKDRVHEEIVCAIRAVACNQIYLGTKLEELKYLNWPNNERTPDIVNYRNEHAVY
jgi:DNA-binding NarL/FixJ family response regulator